MPRSSLQARPSSRRTEVGSNLDVWLVVESGEFGGDDELVTVFVLRHPFAKPELRFLSLIVVGLSLDYVKPLLGMKRDRAECTVSIKLPPSSCTK